MDQGFIHGDDVQLYTEVRGAGQPVVFGHGLVCNSSMFRAITEPLAETCRTVSFDFRGHGQSSVPDTWTMQSLADDYLSILNGCEIPAATLVGFSMGGMAALHLALRHPERVQAMVLIDTDANSAGYVQWMRLHALATSVRVLGLRQWILDEAARATFSPVFRRSHPEVVSGWQDDIKQMPIRAIERAARMVAERPSVVDRLAELTMPVLVVVGSEDQTTPPGLAERMAEKLPDGSVEIIPEAGHAVPIEQPEKTIQLIRDFLHSRAAQNDG